MPRPPLCDAPEPRVGTAPRSLGLLVDHASPAEGIADIGEGGHVCRWIGAHQDDVRGHARSELPAARSLAEALGGLGGE